MPCARVDDLRLWGQRHGLITHCSSGQRRRGRAELDRRRVEARELLYGLFLGRVHGLQRTRRRRLARLGRLASDGVPGGDTWREEADGRLGWSWDPSQLATVRHVAVASAVESAQPEPGRRG